MSVSRLVTLKSKERKKILERLGEQFGADTSFLKRFVFLKQERKEKYFLVNEEVYELPLDELRVESLGLYLCAEQGGELRLSVEGSQLLGPHATRGVLELTDEQFHDWMRGRDVTVTTSERTILLVKHGDDYCGCGKPVTRNEETLLKNYLPKTRHVRSEE